MEQYSQEEAEAIFCSIYEAIDNGQLVFPGPMPSAIWFEFRDGVLHRADKPAPATLEDLS